MKSRRWLRLQRLLPLDQWTLILLRQMAMLLQQRKTRLLKGKILQRRRKSTTQLSHVRMVSFCLRRSDKASKSAKWVLHQSYFHFLSDVQAAVHHFENLNIEISPYIPANNALCGTCVWDSVSCKRHFRETNIAVTRLLSQVLLYEAQRAHPSL